jgi:hypothetical protein
VLQRTAERLVDDLGLIVTLILLVGLLLETKPLLGGNVQLGVTVACQKPFNVWADEMTYALAISLVETKTSNLSHSPGISREALASGDII